MNCTDCIQEGINVTLIYDLAAGGMVCDRCNRVYSKDRSSTDRNYVDKKSCEIALKKYLARRKDGTQTRFLTDMILKDKI